MTGWGKPPEQIHTIAGPYQHGNSVLSYRLTPRTISMELVTRECSRDEWFNRRSRLLDQMGLNNALPNAPVPGVLRWHFIENNVYKRRDLDVFLTRGLAYEPLSNWRSHSLVENLEFTANNPVIYDPTPKSSVISTWTDELIFPATFPIVLGASYGTVSITYAGTWESFPTIVIAGPASGIYIENVSTGYFLRLDYNISVGETVTITLTYNARSVINNLGQSLIEHMSEDSSLGNFTLQTDEIVAGGVNIFYVYTISPDTTTRVTLNYLDRYYGI
jgi:hypothetical protein